MEKWKIIKEDIDNAYYVVIDGEFIYLDNECKSTIFPHPYFTLEAAQKNLERRQKQMSTSPPVDWSQPIQTDEKPATARKARLICDDRKSPRYKRLVLIECHSSDLVAQCKEDGNGVMVHDGSIPIRIVNVPAKTPYGREDWEQLTRVRSRHNETQSFSVGIIQIDRVEVGDCFYSFEDAAGHFLTMDGKELYK